MPAGLTGAVRPSGALARPMSRATYRSEARHAAVTAVCSLDQ